MLKRDLIKALEVFKDDDHLVIDELAVPYVPKIETVCGRTREATGLYCSLPPGHSHRCYSQSKQMYFDPDSNRPSSRAVAPLREKTAWGLYRPDGTLFSIRYTDIMTPSTEDFWLSQAWPEIAPPSYKSSAVPRPLAEQRARELHWSVAPVIVVPTEKLHDLNLCESAQIVPHPGDLYRYTVAPGCDSCAKEAAPYVRNNQEFQLP